MEENIFRLFPVELSVFTNSFDKKNPEWNNLGEEKSKKNQTRSAICNQIAKKKSDIKNSSMSNPVKHELTGSNYHHFSLWLTQPMIFYRSFIKYKYMFIEIIIIIFTENTYAHGTKKLQHEELYIDGQVPAVPINSKIIFCDISGNPLRYPNYRITGITNYRTVPIYQNADVVRLITENSKFVKIDPKSFLFQISAPKIACVLYSSAFNTQRSMVTNFCSPQHASAWAWTNMGCLLPMCQSCL